MVENSRDELIDCEPLLKPFQDLQFAGRGDDRSLDRLLGSEPDVVLVADDDLLEKTVSLVHGLLERSQGRILVIGQRTEDREIMELLEAGANGYLETRLLARHIEKAVKCIFAGETWVSRKVVALVLERLRIRSGK